TGSFLLAYAMPLKKIYLTGKQPSKVPQLSNKEAESIIIDGRGWTNKNRFETYDKFSDAELLERLGSWSPTVRDRAGIALARRKGTAPPIDAIVALLDSEKIHARYGACQALIQLKAAAAPAIPALLKTLKHEDLWLRILAAEAISQMGASAKDALPEMLTMLAKGESPKDPRGMEQRYLSYFIFGGMLKSISLNEIDQNLLQKAITAGLQNQDGRARGSISNVYDK
ncbi:MAG: acetylesterase, partial [Akkermansiaceae bacterium]